MLTCKEFLAELSDYLDEKTKSDLRGKLERHLEECPNCWVVADTTRKTIQVYKGTSACTIPDDVHSRLMAAMEKKMAAKNQGS
ncbi:MAG TPA: zf-HC2 domain-containing protein [Bryobacteraceae bacterium]|nr:zf-HC2 domain-containing protein [Bryobacteraceae bacterium]